MVESLSKPIQVSNSVIMQDLKNALYAEYNQARDGIHVSDINLCLRETVFRRIDPQKLTDREVGLFTVGRAIHDAIQTLAKQNPNYEVEKEINLDIGGLILRAHIDLFDKKRKIPIEAKTQRKKRLTETGPEEPKPFNIEQLMMYMTLTDSDVGYIVYQMLLDYNNSFRVFEVRMTKQEREIMLQKMIDDAFHLQMNIDLKTPENTKHIALNPDKNWKCQYCHYMNKCYDMRVKNGEFLPKDKQTVK